MSTIHSKKNLLKRTAKLEKELAARSYALKIESALEKVSIAAMSMRRSKDLSGIGSLIFKELKKLGFTDLRNTEIVINNDAKETITSYYYSDYGVTGIIELDYKSNAIVKGWADQLKKASDAFAEVVIPEKEMKAWRKYREEIGYLPDPKLDKAKTVYYYSYSTGLGALSISSFKLVAKEQIKILKRFRNVFQLSYRRYRDLAKAESQAKEAEIELALEKVRAKTMAMRKSEELQETTLVLFRQFKSLGVTAAQVSICVFDEDTRMGEMFVTLKGEKIDRSFEMELDKEIFVMRRAKKAFLEKQKKFSFTVKGKELQEYNHWRNSLIGRKGWNESKAVRRQSWNVNGVFFSRGMMGISSEIQASDEAIKLLERFADVFDLTFTRFLDLQKAEAQAREAQIEAALERVRARTMAMRRSSELAETAVLLFEQLKSFGLKLRGCGFNLWEKDEKTCTSWMSSPEGKLTEPVNLPLTEDPFFIRYYKSRQNEEDFWVQETGGRELAARYQYMRTLPVLSERLTKALKNGLEDPPFLVDHVVNFSNGNLIFITYESCPQAWDMFRRFGKVFEQTYTRFLDLQNAEAQAREAQVEAALERVRASSMAMHRSQELDKVIKELTEQLTFLGFDFDASNITTNLTSAGFYVWNASPAQPIPSGVYIPYKDIDILNWLYSDWGIHEGVKTDIFNKAQKNAFFKHYFSHTEARNISDERKKYILDAKTLHFSFACRKDFALGLVNYRGINYTDEQNNILARFAKVFEQSYIRFLDLQKAEAQTREAQIEAALEKVRSRSLAMHHSDELREMVAVVFEKLKELDFAMDEGAAVILIFSEGSKDHIQWIADRQQSFPRQFKVPYFDHSMPFDIFNARETGKNFFSKIYPLKEKNNYLKYLFETSDDYKKLPDDVKKLLLESKQYGFSVAFEKNSALLIATHTGRLVTEDQKEILKRFAKVFEQSYTRFLDLQKAEAQAREAQIEAALERVRSKTMAMHNSNDVGETVAAMFAEFVHLGIRTNRCGILIFNDQYIAEVWTARSTPGGNARLIIGKLDLDAHKMLRSVYNAWNAKETFYQYDLLDNDLVLYYTAINNLKFYPTQFDLNALPSKEFHSEFFFADGAVFSFTNEPLAEKHSKIMKRFAGVFGQTYRRYLDLQKAEAQAREAQIEAGLERVRARTMAMFASDELAETAVVVYKQMNGLGIIANRLYIVIINDDSGNMEFWITDENGDKIGSRHLVNVNKNISLKTMFDGWANNKKTIIIDQQTNELQDWLSYWKENFHISFKDDNTIKRRVQTIAYFSKGFIAMASPDDQPQETIQVLERFAAVFNLTYTRFLDLQKAEAQAREAQIEASLERVRASAMAMHRSDELSNVLAILFEQFDVLKIQPVDVHLDLFDLEKNTFSYRATGKEGKRVIAEQIVDLGSRPEWQALLQKWKNGKPNTVDFSYYPKEVIKELMAFFPDIWAAMPGDAIMSPEDFPDGIFDALGFCKFGYIGFHHRRKATEEEQKILIRFANEFERLYQRFLDLQKAEAQAREAQIQLSLERVRARTMAMHGSDELNDLVKTLFEELIRLDVKLATCLISTFDISTLDETSWMFHPITREPYVKRIPYNEQPFYHEMLRAWKERNAAWNYCLEGETKRKWHDFLFTDTEFALLPQSVTDEMRRPDKVFFTASYYSYGAIQAASLQPFPVQSIDIIQRFSKVFDSSYTRFLDLQKAEAQTRESKIQLSLERVRARTMAMHKSEELPEVAEVLYNQLKDLGDDPERITIGIMSKDNRVITWWATDQGGSKLNIRFQATADEPTVMLKLYNSWKAKHTSLVVDLTGPELSQWVKYCREVIGVPINEEILQNRRVQTAGFFSHGCVMITSPHLPDAETINILERFTTVFDLTFRRFLDLQKAEAQTREAQIEAGLERVRARTMAMHTSDDVSVATATMFTELEKLGVENFRGGITNIHSNRTQEVWSVNNLADGKSVKAVGVFNMDAHPFWQLMYEEWINKKDFVYTFLSGKEKEDYIKVLNATQGYLPQAIQEFPDVHFQVYVFNEGGVWTNSLRPHSEEDKQVMKKFASVFSLTFRRYQDLKKAEAQAREATIEAALERVRAKAMAMHNSEDLNETIKVFYQQVSLLSLTPRRCGVGLFNNENKIAYVSVMNTTEQGESVETIGNMELTGHPVLKSLYDHWLSQQDYFPVLRGNQIKEYYQFLRPHLNYPDYPNDAVQFGYFFCFPEGVLYAWTTQELPEEELKIYRRFNSVLSLTYKRYKDLRHAEAQAREATVEAALEKVRSSAMAMHSSNDISSTTTVVFEELKKLNIHSKRCGVALLSKDSHTCHVYAAATSSDGKFHTLRRSIEMTQHRSLEQQYESWIKQENYIVEMRGQELRSYYQLPFFYSSPDYVPPTNYEHTEYGYYIPFSEGLFYAWTEEPYSEDEINILNRFKKIVDLTFRRYFDLQKAEAQAREATIEAALEKVRGKAMAMHNSNDLSVTASMVFTELRKLGINPIRCGVGLLNKESRKAQLYSATSSADGDSLSLVGWAILSEHPVLEKIYQSWMDNEEYYPELQGEQMRSYYELLLKGLPVAAPQVEDDKKQFGTFLPFSVGCLYSWSEAPYNETEIKILKRFATIIDLTFRRYLELQKSEANAREAVKQAAVDRIRADIASMRTIGDLDRITPLIWNELTILGLPFIRCGVFIMDNSQKLIHTFLSTPDGKAIGAFHLPYDTPGSFADMVIHWENKKTFITHWGEIDMMVMADVLVKQGAIATKEQYLRSLPNEGFYLHFLPFLQGMLYVANLEKLNDEQIELIKHVADAFSTAYARYEDFNKLEAAKQQVEKTLTDLKKAQTLLVQSEKMASLGELTAGIAHEIQNPLNFVNNFSDVSNELLDEMKEELAKGNVEGAIAIAQDVRQNLEKINHHGKRADGIVKGMLQHSRTSSSQKEMTNINTLADEYLRLAYHGLRAKDKSFNAKFETSFDKNVGEINIIPQDIGRVILNLINNAFYAVNERKKVGGLGYEPTVTVSTASIQPPSGGWSVQIKVSDNGGGITHKVLDKIFQPFFTTKPTGQGTGLGLSLAYDIVKAHGGDIRVETKEGEGSEFIIQLSVV